MAFAGIGCLCASLELEVHNPVDPSLSTAAPVLDLRVTADEYSQPHQAENHRLTLIADAT